MVDFRVDFLIAGAQKAGTTALYGYLSQHPAIGMAPNKEVHFFDDEDSFRGGLPDYRRYHSAFDAAGEKVIYGEATPIYLYWQECPRRIWEYNPRMRIIVVLRDPMERAYSHWRMEYERGTESLPFGEAIRSERERCREALPLQHRVYSYVDRGFYVEQLRRLWRYFAPEQVRVLKQERLLQDPGSTLSEVYRFLGVGDPDSLPPPAPYEQKSAVPAADIEYLRSVFEPEVRQLERLLDWDCSHWLRQADGGK